MSYQVKALVVTATRDTARTGSQYLRLSYNVLDDGGVVISKDSVFFDNGSADGDSFLGKVCDVTMEDTSYRGQPSTKILKVRTTTEDPSKYMKQAAIGAEKMMNELRWFVEQMITEPSIKAVIDSIFSSGGVKERFMIWPAARKNHHAFRSGLLQHVLMMLRMGRLTMEQDISYAKCDHSVVVAAIILHDLGKIWEYDFDGSSQIGFSMLGSILGHIVIADEVITSAAAALKIDTHSGPILHLRHCCLSHHSKLDWGSPVVPRTIEAMLVHQMDMLDGKGQAAESALEGVEPGAESEWNQAVGNKLFNL